MLTLRILPRGIISYLNTSAQKLHTTLMKFEQSKDASSSSSDSSDSDSDNENARKLNDDSEKNDVEDNLRNILSKMISNEEVSKTINIAKSSKSTIPVLKKLEREKKEKNQFDIQFVKAAKEVATTIGGDVEKIESELLYKDADGKCIKIEKGKKDKKAKKEENDASEEEATNLMNLLLGMEIKQASEIDPLERLRAARAKQYTKVEPKSTYRSRQKFNLFETNIGGIFENFGEPNANEPILNTWNKLEERELKISLMLPPENYFQEMIQWTEKGMFWHFPIDNEQGLTSEKDVHFSEHVFMERHLQDWCPKKGPIRHFMELVCVGLSKNAFLTVEEKIDHIQWYKDYFSGKENLLKEMGALPDGHTFNQNASKDEKQAQKV